MVLFKAARVEYQRRDSVRIDRSHELLDGDGGFHS